jgi:hypothetical protein
LAQAKPKHAGQLVKERAKQFRCKITDRASNSTVEVITAQESANAELEQAMVKRERAQEQYEAARRASIVVQANSAEAINKARVAARDKAAAEARATKAKAVVPKRKVGVLQMQHAQQALVSEGAGASASSKKSRLDIEMPMQARSIDGLPMLSLEEFIAVERSGIESSGCPGSSPAGFWDRDNTHADVDEEGCFDGLEIGVDTDMPGASITLATQ